MAVTSQLLNQKYYPATSDITPGITRAPNATILSGALQRGFGCMPLLGGGPILNGLRLKAGEAYRYPTRGETGLLQPDPPGRHAPPATVLTINFAANNLTRAFGAPSLTAIGLRLIFCAHERIPAPPFPAMLTRNPTILGGN